MVNWQLSKRVSGLSGFQLIAGSGPFSRWNSVCFLLTVEVELLEKASLLPFAKSIYYLQKQMRSLHTLWPC